MTTNATEAKLGKIVKRKQKDQQKALLARREKLRASIQRAFATADGKMLLHYLKEECGYQKNSVQGSTKSGEFLQNNTMYNEGRRDLYLSLRKLVRPETLASVEVFGVSIDMVDDDTYEDLFK